MKFRKLWFIYPWMLSVLFSIAIHIKLIPYAHDDAYIYVRIADHLARFGVPYFNLSEAVQANSSAAWLLVLAIVFKLTSANVVVVAVLNGLFTATAALVYTRLVRELIAQRIQTAVYLLFFFLFFSLTLLPSTGLMESSFAVLVLGIGIRFLMRQKVYAFVVFGAAIFCRLELVVFLILFGAVAIFWQKMDRCRVLTYAILGMLPFVAFNLLYFHALLPNTIAAKSIVYKLTLTDVFNVGIPTVVPNSEFFDGFPYFQTLVLVPLALALVAAILHPLVMVIRHKKPTNADFIIYALLIGGLAIGGAYIAAKAMIFQWYAPLFAIPILVACYAILMHRQLGWLFAVIIIFSSPLETALIQTIQSATEDIPVFTPNFATGARVRKYLEVGDQLYQTFPGATLLTSEIGGLGTGFSGRILDGMGLVSPSALAYHPMAVPGERSSGLLGAIPERFIEANSPDIVVSEDVFAQAFLRSAFRRNYWRIRQPIYLDSDMEISPSPLLWGSRYLNIFIRRDYFKKPVGQFGNTFQIETPTLSPAKVVAGGDVRVTSFWHTLRTTFPNYSAVAVLVNEKGQIVVRKDEPVLSPYVLFDAWQGNGIYMVTHFLTIPGNLQPGKYSVALGVYSSKDNKLIALEGQHTDYLLPIGTIEVGLS
jgi:hypothetical protein